MGKVSSGVAAKVLNISRLDFLDLLEKYKVSYLDTDVYPVSEKQRIRLQEAQSDKLLSEYEANLQIEKWLNEK